MAKAKRPRGTGSLYKRGQIWWYSFVRDGVLERESSNSPLKTVAQAKLDAALKDDSGIQKTRATVGDLVKTALAFYEREGRGRALSDATDRWRLHLEPVFGCMRAAKLSTEKLNEYATARLQTAARATINREFALLRFAFNRAHKARTVALVPYFPMLRENNTRTGFLADAQFAALAAACAKRGLWLRAMLEVGYQFGWRSSEIKTMQVGQVDLAARTLRLEVLTTKNEEGREAVMPPILFGLIQQCVTGKAAGDYVFTRDTDHRTVVDFRSAWREVTKEAKVPDIIFHDLRRTAVRNLIRRGVPEKVAMRITGHKTRSVFDRYNIVSHTDLRDAAEKMAKPVPSLTIDPQQELTIQQEGGKLLN
jgi:integrase